MHFAKITLNLCIIRYLGSDMYITLCDYIINGQYGKASLLFGIMVIVSMLILSNGVSLYRKIKNKKN